MTRTAETKRLLIAITAVVILDGTLAYFRNHLFFDFVARPFVFGQAFCLCLWSGTAKIGPLLSLVVTAAYLIALAPLLPAAPPSRMTFHLAHAPATCAIICLPALVAFVTIPSHVLSKSERRFSLRHMLLFQLGAALVLVELILVPIYDDTLGSVLWRAAKHMTKDSHVLFILALSLLKIPLGWCCVAAIRMPWGRKPFVFLCLVTAVMFLIHFVAVHQFHAIPVSLSHLKLWYAPMLIIYPLATLTMYSLLRLTMQ